MRKLIRTLLFKWLKRRAVKARLESYNAAKLRAEKVHAETGKKCLVFYSGSEFKVLTKEQIRAAKAAGLFKGLNYEQIERKAVFTAA